MIIFCEFTEESLSLCGLTIPQQGGNDIGDMFWNKKTPKTLSKIPKGRKKLHLESIKFDL